MGVRNNIPQPPIRRNVRPVPPKRFGAEDRVRSTQGIGPSRRFNAPDADSQPPAVDWSTVTVNGESLPEKCWATFPYSLTDQGKAGVKEVIDSLPLHLRPGSGMRDRTDYDRISDDDKKLGRYRDELADAPPSFTPTKDPMKVLMDRHTPAGHRGLFIGPRKEAESGLLRGSLEYQPVLVKNKDTGQMERVKCGGMYLASVPEDLARQQEHFNSALNREKTVQTQEKVREQADRIMGPSSFADLARRKRLLDDISGSMDDNPEQADQELLAHESA